MISIFITLFYFSTVMFFEGVLFDENLIKKVLICCIPAYKRSNITDYKVIKSTYVNFVIGAPIPK